VAQLRPEVQQDQRRVVDALAPGRLGVFGSSRNRPDGRVDRTPYVESGASEADLREQAIAQLKKKRDFRTHLFMYVAVNAMLVVIWAITSDGGLFWPIFPILGWGIGVAGNAWDVYGRKPLREEDIQREQQRLRS
jgi:hypothetical protein